MSIIIVDDNATNLLIIEKILRKEGYEDLVLAASAMELYDILDIDSTSKKEVTVNLILMDMMMPEIDGLEACRRIQELDRFRDIPIIFVTALGDSNKLAEALDAGAIDYVMKPINKVELLARIRSAFRLKMEKDWHKERDKRIKYELDLAKQVQRSVLSEPIQDGKVEIGAVYKPSSELAGDFYAWHRIGPSRYGIILLDMMGHGISSSLVCMYIYSHLQDTITRISDPEEVMHELNRHMNQLHMSDELIQYYFTAIYLVLDTEQKTVEYVNAGHPAGVIEVDGEITTLSEGCCAIGFFDNIDIRKGMIRYQHKMKAMLFTDGLIEWIGEDQESGTDKLLQTLRSSSTWATDDLIERLVPKSDTNIQQDDVCLVLIETN
ncbi:MAG: fused response regulator/phosphatase [Paenibacillus sp.]|jgi:sigma-B regulation protein RsbU (phosphoserine phosphatase)|nr:fused response regulator/phosphatase [Paenibacillus sp.]